MRILHTSDWHVGRALKGRSRDDEHRAVLAEITEIARREAVDLVLIAGDVFDTHAPAAQAEQIVYRALLDLVGTGAQVVLVAGNHDNPRRWRAVQPFLDLTQVHLGAELARPEAGGCIDVAVRSGETARIALLPFLSQSSIVRADDLMATDAAQQAQLYQGRYARLLEALCAGFTPGTVNIVLAHPMVVNGRTGGGERLAQTGLDYAVPAAAFPTTANYLALGHLHACQPIASAAPGRYSGSPLQFDFGDTEETKHVVLVEARPGLPSKVEELRLTTGRRLVTLRGSLAAVQRALAGAGDAYLRVLLDEQPRPGLGEEVRALAADILDVQLKPTEPPPPPPTPPPTEASPQEMFAAYLKSRGAQDPDVEQLFADLLEEAYAPAPA